MKVFKSVNPFDQSLIAEYEVMSDEVVDHLLENASAAFAGWKKENYTHRSDLLKSVAGILRKRKDSLARTITLEMGKAIKESKAEIEKCAWCCEYYAENGETFMKSEVVQSDAKKSLIA